jgi:hypothetical protein
MISAQYGRNPRAVSTMGVEKVQLVNPFSNFTVDMTLFRRKIEYVLENKNFTANGAQCSLPDGAVMFTVSNQHVIPLLTLRQSIMKRYGVMDCLQQRLITVCLDPTCQYMCTEQALPNCIELSVPTTVLSGFGMVQDDYQKWSYNYIVWLKYELFMEALEVANEFFYFDADVVLFKDPFPATRYGRDENGTSFKAEYDFMFQRERGVKEWGCGGSVNGGVMWFRNNSALHEKLFPAMLERKDEIVNVHGNDQDIIGSYAYMVRKCALPATQYMGHCTTSRDNRATAANVVTFHTNCVSGLQRKLAVIRSFERQYQYALAPNDREKKKPPAVSGNATLPAVKAMWAQSESSRKVLGPRKSLRSAWNRN